MLPGTHTFLIHISAGRPTVKLQTESLAKRTERFFFEEEVPYGLALVRISLPLALLTMVLARWSAARELFSSEGATAPLAVGYGYLTFLPEFSGSVTVAGHEA